MRIYSFEKLEVWKLSKKLTIRVYNLTKSFPNDEKFGIVNQIRRASFSITNNLAEGTSRTTKKEKSRFIEIAYGSLLEVLNILIISEELEYVTENEFLELRELIEEIGNKLNALKRSFERLSI